MNIALWMAGHVPYPVIFLSGINVSHIAATLTAQFVLWASIFCEIGFRFYLYLTIDLPFQSNEVISTKTVFLLALIYFSSAVAKLLSQHYLTTILLIFGKVLIIPLQIIITHEGVRNYFVTNMPNFIEIYSFLNHYLIRLRNVNNNHVHP